MLAPTVRLAVAGAVATLLQDAIMVPVDTVKQRRQLDSVGATWATLMRLVRTEGVRGLYAGYTTTVAMNVPFHAIYFNAYERARHAFAPAAVDDNGAFSPSLHLAAGGVAGVTASALTNPLDVARTRLQTQGHAHAYRGMVATVRRLWREEGPRCFARGIVPRMVFHSASAAVLWVTYEYLKLASLLCFALLTF